MKKKWEEEPWVVTFDPDDSMEEKLKKAAHVKPSEAQLAWMEKEFIAFIHFGPNTFTGMQWGSGQESTADYNPTELNVAQWCQACAQAGMRLMLFTAKHHDGFCQWYTQSTDFSVENTAVHTDIMEQLSKGCTENKMELGVYLSPWDMHQRERKLWGTTEYNKYFLTQLEELLTQYGSISEVWFDGACNDYEIWKAVPSYQPQSWYELIAAKQPAAVIRLYDPFSFSTQEEWQEIKDGKAPLSWSGRGVRWVGNEGGSSRPDEWSVQAVNEREIAENATLKDLGQERYYEKAVGAIWYPLEVNTVILNQWFWNEKTSCVRSLPDLVEVYYNSIGNNGVLLLNLSPDTRGLLGEDQMERLQQLKDYIMHTFADNLSKGATVYASEELPEHPAEHIIDDNKMTYWTVKDTWALSTNAASLTVLLDGEKTFDNLLLQEYVREGQRVAEWNFEIWKNNEWQEVLRHKTIGYKRIERFAKVSTSKVRINILRSWDRPMISGFGLYLAAALPETAVQADLSEIELHPEAVERDTLRTGLCYRCYDGGLQSAALMESVFAVKLLKTDIVRKIDGKYAAARIGYSLSYVGYLHIPKDDEYSFQLESCDGSLFYLGGSLLIYNDEPHEQKSMTRTIFLKEGYYAIKVLYTSFRHDGMLRLGWQSPDFALQEIAAEYFYYQPAVTT